MHSDDFEERKQNTLTPHSPPSLSRLTSRPYWALGIEGGGTTRSTRERGIWNAGVCHTPHEHWRPPHFQRPTTAWHLGHSRRPSCAVVSPIHSWLGSTNSDVHACSGATSVVTPKLRRYLKLHACDDGAACGSTFVLSNKTVRHLLHAYLTTSGASVIQMLFSKIITHKHTKQETQFPTSSPPKAFFLSSFPLSQSSHHTPHHQKSNKQHEEISVIISSSN